MAQSDTSLAIPHSFCFRILSIFADVKCHPPIGLLLLLAVLAACAKRVPPPEEDMLYCVECFYQQSPDSAMQILDTLNLECLSEKERAHYCLLKAKTNQRQGTNDAATDSLLKVAENYFIGGKDKYFEAMTYWTMSGLSRNNAKERHAVLDYRLKALQSIEQCQHVDERIVRYSPTPTNEQDEIDRLKYAIHQRLGMSYTSNHYFREGVMHLKVSELYYAQKKKHKLHVMSAYMLGYAYLGLNEFDSCLMSYQRGLRSAEAIADTDNCAYYHLAMADYYNYCHSMQQPENESDSNTLLRKVVSECQQCLSFYGDSMQKANQVNAWKTMAGAYFGLCQYDSCLLYGLKALAAQEVDGSRSLYECLYGACKALGDMEGAVRYADALLRMESEYRQEQNAVAEVKEEYEKQLEINQLKTEQQIKRYRLYLWIALLLIVLLALLWMVFRYRKNKEIETLRLREESLRLQEESLRLLSDKERIAHEVSENLQNRVHKIYTDGKEDAYQRILNDFNATYPKAWHNLMEAYPSLSELEYGLCVLGFLSFRAKESAQLLGFQENTIGKYRSSIRKKTGVADLKELMRSHLD